MGIDTASIKMYFFIYILIMNLILFNLAIGRCTPNYDHPYFYPKMMYHAIVIFYIEASWAILFDPQIYVYVFVIYDTMEHYNQCH